MPAPSRRTLLRGGGLVLSGAVAGCAERLAGGVTGSDPATEGAAGGAAEAAPDVLKQSLPDPEQFVADQAAGLERASGTLAVDSESGVLRFGSDGAGDTVTAVGGYVAADALVAHDTWTGTLDPAAKRIGASAVDGVGAVAFTPASFGGVAVRATEAVDLYVDGVLVIAGVTLVRYSTDRGVFGAVVPEAERDGDDGVGDEDWPAYQHDARNTGYNPAASSPTEEPTPDWTFEADIQDQGPSGYSVPAVAGDAVFVVNQQVGRVHALEAATDAAERERWWFDLGDGPNPPEAVAVADGTVYAGADSGVLYAIPVEGGQARWAKDHSDEDDDTDPWFNPATVADGTVYVGTAGLGDTGGTLYARDASSGDLEWSFDFEDSVYRAPAVVDGRAFLGDGGTLHAVEDGESQWSFDEWGPANVGAPAVRDGTVYVGSTEEGVYAISAEDGTEQWPRPFPIPMNGSPTVTDDAVYLMDGRYVYKVDPGNGERLELYDADPGLQWEFTPGYANGTLYVGHKSGKVIALAADTLEEQWTFQVEGTPGTYAVPADDRVYVGTSKRFESESEGTVYALSAP